MKVIYMLLFVLSSLGVNRKVFAQDDIKFTPVFLSSDVNAKEGSINILKNKFKNEVSKNHYFSNEISRFLLVINPNRYDIQQSSEHLIIKYNLQFELYDLVADQTFHSFSLTLGGVGKTEAQAFADAVNRLNSRNKSFREEMETGVRNLINFYTENCERILVKAELLKNAQKYKEAFAQLYLIPNLQNTDCITRYNRVFKELWKEYNVHHCENIINQANLLWSTNPTEEGARDVAILLQGLDLNGGCQKSFNQLLNSIKEKLINDDFDEKEFRRMIVTGTFEVEKSRLNAISDVTSAYFNSLISDKYIIIR